MDYFLRKDGFWDVIKERSGKLVPKLRRPWKRKRSRNRNQYSRSMSNQSSSSTSHLLIKRDASSSRRISTPTGFHLHESSSTKFGDDILEEITSTIIVGTKDDVCKTFREMLLKVPVTEDEIENHLEAEENIRHFNTYLCDNEFSKETLTQIWLGIGYIRGEHKHVISSLFVEVLLSTGYLIRTGTCFKSKKDLYRVNSAASTMQDKLKEKVNNNEGHGKEEHLCLMGDDANEASRKEVIMRDYKNLKVLLLLSKTACTINTIPHDVFSALKYLEVLHLSGAQITELPSSVGELTELKYLDLSHTLIEVLPESVRNLSKLQTLKLNNCECLLRLPEATKKLTSLEHLELDVLTQLSMMPKGMGALTKLRTLSAFIIHSDDGHSIKELKDMNDLKGSFCISKLENVSSTTEANEAALSQKFLDDLELRWSSDSHEDMCGDYDDDKILEKLQPNTNLQQLKISCYGGNEFPIWIGNPLFKMLHTVTIFRCDRAEVLPSLGQLPSLKYLCLMEINNVKEIGSQFQGSSIAFPKLERLEMIGFPLLETWEVIITNEDYPCLNELVIEQCPHLAKVPSSLLQLPNLMHLEILQCSALTSFFAIKLSTSLVTLIIDECPLITKELKKHKSNDRLTFKHVQSVWVNKKIIQRKTAC